jgi:hypothetical protein
LRYAQRLIAVLKLLNPLGVQPTAQPFIPAQLHKDWGSCPPLVKKKSVFSDFPGKCLNYVIVVTSRRIQNCIWPKCTRVGCRLADRNWHRRRIVNSAPPSKGRSWLRFLAKKEIVLSYFLSNLLNRKLVTRA